VGVICSQTFGADEEEPPRKRKRSLVRKAAAPILSSPGSVDSMDDSEVSNFVVGDDSESDDNELDEDLAEEEESPDITKKSHTVALSTLEIAQKYRISSMCVF
jgi:hypothetical protein